MEVRKIILLMFPLIINRFDFRSTEKESFFDIGKLRKKKLKEKGVTQLNGEEISKLFETDYNREFREFTQNDSRTKLLLVNYPNNQEQFNSLNSELVKEGKKISDIILLNISNYELMLDIKKEYLICPLCERIHKEEEMIKKDEKVICPENDEYQFLLEDIKNFGDYIVEHHLKNTESIVKKFLVENGGSVSSIIRLEVSRKEEIFNGKIEQNLLKIIESL